MSDAPKPSIGSRIKSIFFGDEAPPLGPAPSTFEKLAHAMPAMFRQLKDRKRKKRVQSAEEAIKSGVALPCLVCGRRFGGAKVALNLQEQLKHFCPKCKKRLDAGETALVTMDGKRYRFIVFTGELAKKNADMVGKMVTVNVGTMDAFEKQEAHKNGKITL